MRITEENGITIYEEEPEDVTVPFVSIDIIRAEYVGEYSLHLWFADGVSHVVDFAPFILQARNPMTTKYRDKALFQDFSIEYGNLYWNDHEMCFSTLNLYENSVIEYRGFG
jgi:hypothetical protein